MIQDQQLIVFASSNDLAQFFLKRWVEIANQAVSARNRFTVALSGGRAPSEFYSRLAGLKDFDLWPRIHLFMADERFVPADHPESNFLALKENLFKHIPIPQENIHPIRTDHENAGIAAEHYKDVIVHSMELNEKGLPSFDLILLGLGEDGHTASLFPGADGIDDPGRLTLPVSMNHLKHDRVSLTLPAINNAKHVFFLAHGPQKADVIKHLVEEETDLPAARVRPHDGQLLFLIDKNAAAKLERRDVLLYRDESVSFSGENG